VTGIRIMQLSFLNSKVKVDFQGHCRKAYLSELKSDEQTGFEEKVVIERRDKNDLTLQSVS
jgi:hypothetical protein